MSNGVFTSLKVSWAPGGDDRFVSGYEIFADNNLVGVASATSTSAVVTGLAASKAMSITVRTLDGGRNLSQSSPPTAATTGVGPPALPSPLKGYGELYPVNPSRVLDTRSGIGGPAAPVQAGVRRDVQVTGVGDVPVTGVGMVALNVTVTSPSATGFLTVYPGGEAPPPTSNLNFRTGQTVPNFVLARVPSTGIVSLSLSAGQADVLVDVVGWFGTATRADTRRQDHGTDAGAGSRHPPARLGQGRPRAVGRRAGGGERLGHQRRRAERDGHGPRRGRRT